MLSSRELPVSKYVLAGAAMVVLALAVGGAFALGLAGGELTVIDQVPDDADAVVWIDPTILHDPSSDALLESSIAALGYGTIDADEAATSFESQTGLTLSSVEEVVAFGRYGTTGGLDVRYAGAIVHADWSSEEIRDALGRTFDVSYEERSISDHTVYQPAIDDVASAPTVGVLDEGEFVVGTPLAVDDAIAVANDNNGALGGPVRSALSATDDGLVTFASELPREEVSRFDARTGGLTRLGSIRVVAGTYDTSGDAVSMTVRLRANGTEAARDMTDVARGGVPILASNVDNETVADTLRSVAVERRGQTVTLTLETTPEKLRTIARYYGFGGV